MSASVSGTVNAGSVSFTLTNSEANPTDVAQAISDFAFLLSGGQNSGAAISTSSATTVTINGTTAADVTTGGAIATGWGVDTGDTFTAAGYVHIDDLGFAGPKNLIIGPPDGSGAYSAANGSIAGNKPHNPFLNQSATFTVTVPGITADETVTGVAFSFGTAPGTITSTTTVVVPGGQTAPAPLPASVWGGTGLLALLGLSRLRRGSKTIV